MQGLGDVVGEESSQDSEEESGKKFLCERERKRESLFYVNFCILQLMVQAKLQLLRTSLTCLYNHRQVSLSNS